MGKTVRSWQKGDVRRQKHTEQKRKHFRKGKDRFRFDPRNY